MELSGLRILLVEDSPDNQLLLSRVLKKNGAEVETADDGRLGIQKAAEGNFDIVLMDIQMPQMDGLEATRFLRAQGFNKPIVALSAYAMAEERENSLRAGCDRHITKPIDFKVLVKTIAELCLTRNHE